MGTVNARLVVPRAGAGNFRAEGDGRVWIGATSRSAKTKLVLALRGQYGRELKVRWSLVLPDGVAADVQAYHNLLIEGREGGRDRMMLGDERLSVALQLLDCRLSVAEAACALEITPAWLGRQLGIHASGARVALRVRHSPVHQ